MGDGRMEAEERLKRACEQDDATDRQLAALYYEWRRAREEEVERDSVPAESEAERVHNLEGDR
jgi:hypothetical protein